MYMDVSASVTSIRMSADQCLVAGKVLSRIFHSNGLRALRCQATINLILRVKADDVVMGLDFFWCLVFMVLLI